MSEYNADWGTHNMDLVQSSKMSSATGAGGAGASFASGPKVAMRWTSMMSAFVLRRFVDLVGGGVKIDK